MEHGAACAVQYSGCARFHLSATPRSGALPQVRAAGLSLRGASKHRGTIPKADCLVTYAQARHVTTMSTPKKPFGKPSAPVMETGTEARQGRSGRPVLIVLICGLVLAAVAWGAAEWWGEATDGPAENTATPPAGVPATQSQSPSNSTPPDTGGNTAPTDRTTHPQSGTGGPSPTNSPSGSTTDTPRP
jgi:cytoskeletal protein RodZ